MACRASREQRELLRVVRTPGGEVVFDPTGRANGRGAYVCRDEACIATGSRGGLARALSADIPPHVATELRRQLPTAALPSSPDLTSTGGSLGQE